LKIICAGSFVCDIIAANIPMVEATKPLVYVPEGIQTEVGGHAANVAIDLKKLGQDDVGATGCIGNDLWGHFIQDRLKANNVRIYPQIEEIVKTAKAIVLVVKDIGNLFYAELTANTLLSVEHVNRLLELHKPAYFYLGTVGGLKYIDNKLSTLLRTAKKLNCVTFVDVILPSYDDWHHLEQGLPFIDVLHLNENESKDFTKQTNPIKALQEIMNKGVKLCVLSQGNKGLLAANHNKVLQMPSFKVEQVDPTGAGDALSAGIINSFCESGLKTTELEDIPEEKLKNALLRGQAAGAACVTSMGSTTAVTSLKVKSLIMEQREKVINKTRYLIY
jgi:fructokinase